MLIRRISIAMALCILLTGCFLFAPGPGKGKMAEERFRQSTPVIAALKQYHEKHGAYPDSLSSLVPAEMAGLPRIFTQDDVVDSGTYRRDGSSYELMFRYVEGGMNECIYQPPQGWFCHGYM